MTDPLHDELVPSLPGHFYTSEQMFEKEARLLFGTSWLCVGRVETVAAPGRFVVHRVRDESILVVRGRDERLRAFHNVCRHRGAQLCAEPSGELGKSLRCMYHGWSYGLDGTLRVAPNLTDMTNDAKQQYGLSPVRLDEWLGYVWITLDDTAAPVRDTFLPTISTRLGDAEKIERYAVGELDLASTIDYDVSANWKVLTENFMECYHCAPLHPQLSAVLPQFASGRGTMVGDDTGGAAFAPGTGYSLSGRASGPRLPGLRPTDDGLHALPLHPSALLVLTPDHVAVYRLNPLSAGRTALSVDTMFAPEQARRPDFDPGDTVGLRDVTVRQDIEACERCQRGMRSSAYRGVLVPAENAVVGFHRYLRAALGEPAPAGSES